MMLLLALIDTLAITGGTVHTMASGSAGSVMTILAENGRITDVGADLKVPDGARVVDARGLHVIPGLIDGFVNHDPDHDRLYVSAGVTLVRDVGNDQTRILSEALHDARGRSPGPWIWCAGSVLDGSPPSTMAAVILNTPAEVDQKLPRLFEVEGIDYLSFQAGLPHDAWSRTLELAHKPPDKSRLPKQVWGPLARGCTLTEALAQGQDGFYHLDAFLPAGARWDKVAPADLDAVVKAAGEAKAAITPTLAFVARRVTPPKEGWPELDLLGPFYDATWSRDVEVRRLLVDEDFLKTGLAIIDAQSKLLARLHAAGCRLVPGSGAPNPWLLPGESLLDELSLWKRAGIPTAECVRLATAGAAAAIGAEKRGTIERGKIADLVLTKGDPTEELKNLHAPAIVVLRGRVMMRDELDKLVADVRVQQKKIKDALAKPLEVEAPETPAGDVVLTGHVETRGLGTRVSAERYAVVRRYDGSLTYCGRVVIPGEATTPGTVTTVQQTIRGGELVEFDVSMTSNNRAITVHGEEVAGKFSIERRLNGQFVDTNHVPDRLAFVDCGSMTALLILGYHKKPGRFTVLFFDDYEPAKGPWEMVLDKDALHLVRTPMGALKIAYDNAGGVLESKREVGNGFQQTRSLESKAADGKGLPMPADKRALSASAPRDAAPKDAAPKDPPK